MSTSLIRGLRWLAFVLTVAYAISCAGTGSFLGPKQLFDELGQTAEKSLERSPAGPVGSPRPNRIVLRSFDER